MHGLRDRITQLEAECDTFDETEQTLKEQVDQLEAERDEARSQLQVVRFLLISLQY